MSDGAAGSEGRRPKASKEETAGMDTGARLTVFLRDYETTNRLADGTIDHRKRRAGQTERRPPLRPIPFVDDAFANIPAEAKRPKRRCAKRSFESVSLFRRSGGCSRRR